MPEENVMRCDPHKLAQMARVGDIAALDQMTRCYGQRLLAVGKRYCRTETEAEDAVQDALLAAGTHLQDYRGTGSIEGWLVRMVANACHHMRRGRKNAPELHAPLEGLATEVPTPESLAEQGQLMEALGEALNHLKPEDRALVLLSEAEGWTAPQIGEHLNLSAVAVRSRLYRARARLKEALAPLMAVEKNSRP